MRLWHKDIIRFLPNGKIISPNRYSILTTLKTFESLRDINDNLASNFIELVD